MKSYIEQFKAYSHDRYIKAENELEQALEQIKLAVDMEKKYQFDLLCQKVKESFDKVGDSILVDAKDIKGPSCGYIEFKVEPCELENILKQHREYITKHVKDAKKSR